MNTSGSGTSRSSKKDFKLCTNKQIRAEMFDRKENDQFQSFSALPDMLLEIHTHSGFHSLLV